MGFYNVCFGINPIGAVILAALELTPKMVGRYRDCFVAEGEIVVYTRNGGANRRCWESVPPKDCRCPGCIITHHLPKHPLYLRDRDDDYDQTYATIWFAMPAEYAEELRAMDIGPWDPSARWKAKLAEVEKRGPSALAEPGFVGDLTDAILGKKK